MCATIVLVLAGFPILDVGNAITGVAFSRWANSSAFVMSAAGLVPLVVCGSLTVLRERSLRFPKAGGRNFPHSTLLSVSIKAMKHTVNRWPRHP